MRREPDFGCHAFDFGEISSRDAAGAVVHRHRKVPLPARGSLFPILDDHRPSGRHLTNMTATRTISATPEHTQPSAPLTNPSLSATLRAEYDALQNDVQQAHELAAEFQRQLAGKSNEVAEFKHLFEKTKTDLGRLQASITELREERHRLANEAMRATAFERKLADVTADRNRLQNELEFAKQSASTGGSESERRLIERDRQIAQLSLQLTELRKTTPSPLAPAPVHPPRGKDDSVKVVLSDMWRTLERLQTILDPQGTPAKPNAKPASAEEFIDIAFDR